MKARERQIAIFGTFDVENFGDLLFPIIAEAELTKRLGSVELHRFSYHARTPPEWPYTVTSLTELPAIAGNLDGVLIGGGFIIRFDKDVAADYGPPIPSIHHPTGYWLTPALIALQHGVPLIWNAPGMHCNDIPAWAEPLLRLALEHSSHVTVRDTLSREALACYAGNTQIDVIPDTAFGISQLIDQRQPSAALTSLRERVGLTSPYIVVHAIRGLDRFLQLLKNCPDRFHGYQVLVLPIGPVLGDHETILGDELPQSVRLPFWPQPLLLAELISQAEAVVGHSYHLMITALAFGVPVFASADLQVGKYTSLSGFDMLFPLYGKAEIDPDWFIARIGKKPPSDAARSAVDRLTDHWDRVAAIIQQGSANTQPALNGFWQSLPNLLEAEDVAYQQRSDELSRLLALAQAEIESAKACNASLEAKCLEQRKHMDELGKRQVVADAKIEALSNSRSMKITAPMRFIARNLRSLQEKNRK